MTKNHRGTKGLVSIMAAVCLLLMVCVPVFAEDANEAVKNDRKGVVQVRMVYVNDNGDSKTFQTGTGFLIGKDDTATTLITNYHVVTVDSAYSDYLKQNVWSDFSKDKTRIEIVIKGDVTINATFKKGSQEVDFAVLELEQPIGDKQPLTLASDSSMQDLTTQSVFALGFPQVTTWVEDYPKYTSDQVSTTSGTISQQSTFEGSKVIQHNADLSKGGSGGPLVSPSGVVIGVNTYGLKDGFNGSVDIREITEILRMLNIEYEEGEAFSGTASSTTKKTDGIDKSSLEAAIKSAEEISKDTSKYSSDSVKVFQDALSAAKAVNDKADATQENIDNATTDLKNAQTGLTENTSLNWLLIGGIALAVIVVVVVVIMIMMKNKKKSSQGAETLTGTDFGSLPSDFGKTEVGAMSGSSDGGDATSVLNDSGAGQTTMMGSMPNAILQRKDTMETIQITQSVFRIGKERKKVDYCVSDNTSVSRVHVIISCRDGEFYLQDQNATNGTYVNEGRVSGGQEVKLKNNDKIKLSNVEFEFKC